MTAAPDRGPAARDLVRDSRRRSLRSSVLRLVGAEERRREAPPVVGPASVAEQLMPGEDWFLPRVRHLAFAYRVAGVSDPVLAAVLDALQEGWRVPAPLVRTIWSGAGVRPPGRVW